MKARPAPSGLLALASRALVVTGTTLSSEGLDPRRRRLLYHAWHRGTREMDLIMGRFADTALPTMSDEELEAFERLSDVPDDELYAWIAGGAAVPETYDTPLFRRLRDFQFRKDKR
jgi:antitoxin CptB